MLPRVATLSIVQIAEMLLEAHEGISDWLNTAELGRLKGEFEAIENVSIQKNC